MRKNKLNDLAILITAAGSPGTPGLMMSLRNNKERQVKIIASDIDEEAAGLYLADKWYLEPVSESKDYVKKILAICKKEKVNVVIPNTALLPLSKHISEFENIGVKVLISKNYSALEKVIDKGKLYRLLESFAIPVPRYKIAKSFDEFIKAVRLLGYPQESVCFKPAISEGSRGFHILDSKADKERLLLYEKPNTTVAPLEDIIPTLSSISNFPEIIVMEYLPEKEYSVDMLIRAGEALIIVPRYRKLVKAGISVVGIVEKNSEIISLCKKIAEKLNLEFVVNVQIKYSRFLKPKVIEINPRVSGSLVLCTGAEVNLAYLGLKTLLGEDFSVPRPLFGTKMIRFWSEVFLNESRLPYTL